MIAKAAAALTLVLLVAIPGPSQQRGRELLRDPHFQDGFQILATQSFKRVVQKTVRWQGAKAEPVWDICQWNSRSSLADADPQRVAAGVGRLSDASKKVTVGRRGTEQADLALGVDSRPDYPDHARRKDEPWVHLLVQQEIVDCPPLTEMKSLNLTISARLLESERFPPQDYSAGLHCAQFPFVLIIQNRNKSSPGFGDFIWFSVGLYDDRWKLTPKYVAQDTADPSAKMIYNAGQEAYGFKTLHDKEWVKIDLDLLPHILDGLKAAWDSGYLKDSKDAADYRIISMNLGWEVPGINKVEIQVRDLSLKVLPKAAR